MGLCGDFMHAVLCKLMAALLFVHGAFGCCWHHAHAWEFRDGATASTAQHHHCCKHESPADHSQQPTKPCEQKCEGVCTYLPVQKVQVDSPDLTAPAEFLAITPMPAGSDLSVASFWELGGGPVPLGPPLRLHLLHQILLI